MAWGQFDGNHPAFRKPPAAKPSDAPGVASAAKYLKARVDEWKSDQHSQPMAREMASAAEYLLKALGVS